jgi:hypothetical protein
MGKALAEQHALAQWKLVRSAIEHENILVSNRVTWLLATQLFLFAGYSSIFVQALQKDQLFGSRKVYASFLIISCIGIYICILAWANLRAAQRMIGRLRDWWIRHYSLEALSEEDWIKLIQQFSSEKRFPPVNGIFTERLHELFSEMRLPAVIATCWLLLLALTTALFARRHGISDDYIFGWGLFALAAGWLAMDKVIKPWLKSDSKKLRAELREVYTILYPDRAPPPAPPPTPSQDPRPGPRQPPHHQPPEM